MTYNTINDAQTIAGGDSAGALFAGRYRIVRQLGSGGMGSVCLAEDTKLDNKLFAIKMLPSHLVFDKRAYMQLQKEALVAMQLVHPNIVQICDFAETNGTPFLVMDYVEGQTLDDYIADKGTLTEDETVRLLTPVADALDYAHGEGVVHRDIKPANVMIRKDGRPFILDFGIAREIQETMTRVTGKLSSGTLLYMSPEQLNGEPPSPAQDVYSFAVMVYECLKGEPPFVRGQLEHQILNKQPPTLPQGISSILAEAVMRGLAKKNTERPTSCCEIIGFRESGSGNASNNIKSLTQQAINAYQNKDYEKAFALAQKADQGNAEIQYLIGKCYLLGDGVEADESEALQWFYKAVKQGNVDALYIMGKLYRGELLEDCALWDENELKVFQEWFARALDSSDNRVKATVAYVYVRCQYYEKMDTGVIVNEEKALELIRQAADNGYHRAQYQLGCRYESGDGVQRDYAVAAKWYCKAAEQSTDYRYAQKLGEVYKKGLGVTKDYDEAIKWYHKAVESLDSAANEYELAQMYEFAAKYTEAVKWYRKAAGRGFSDAQCKLGDMYRFGRGVDTNFDEEVKWYRKAAEQDNAKAQYFLALDLCISSDCSWSGEPMDWLRKAGENGYPDAQLELGSIYVKGIKEDCIAIDPVESAKWYGLAEKSYRMTAENGNVVAQKKLGLMYYKGDGVVQDFEEAFKWINKAALGGNCDAQYYLGNCYMQGQGVSQNYMEAVKWYREASERGHAAAQNAIGCMYKNGMGVIHDYKEAMAWFIKSAERHNSDACVELGIMYYNGLGGTKDYVKAANWFGKETADPRAAYYLGQMYENGYGVKRDSGKAAKLYLRAAVRGNVDAQYQIGLMHYNGQGIEKDASKAAYWFRKAASQNNLAAQCNIGIMYANGEGVAKDEGEAVKWLRKASDKGNADAQYALGVMYETGQGVKINKDEAVKLYRMAADQGHADAQSSLKQYHDNGVVDKRDEQERKYVQEAAKDDEEIDRIRNFFGIK